MLDEGFRTLVRDVVAEVFAHYAPSMSSCQAPEPLLLTMDQAAELTGFSAHWLRLEATAGRFPARKIGQQWRCRKQDILAWYEGQSPAIEPDVEIAS